MSLYDDLDEIFNEKEKLLNSFDKEAENYFKKIYLGWQCPICKEIYNPRVMNCIATHKPKRRLNGRPDDTISL